MYTSKPLLLELTCSVQTLQNFVEHNDLLIYGQIVAVNVSFTAKEAPANNNRFRLLHFFTDLEVITDQFFAGPQQKVRFFFFMI